ncbi:MAG: ferrous iron transport protein B [Candidatus Cryptobacteroides sp.]
MKISELKIGQSAKVLTVGGEGSLRQHLLGMGLIPGSILTLQGRAPMGDPLELSLQSYSLTLRSSEADKVDVEPVPGYILEQEEDKLSKEWAYSASAHELNSHPGFGEEGKYHSKDHAHPLPKGEKITFALVGQQNSGKTTLFNQLTGSNQHVGNFPGVTVDRKDGALKNHPEATVTDLPGIYSLSTYTQEELVSRRFILENKPKAIINIVDAGNIERHLYLTMQLMELDVPVVLALNMMDELKGNGGTVRLNVLERELGLPVVPISAAKGEGVEELVEHALHIASFQEKPARQDFCSPEEHKGAVHKCLHAVMHLIEDRAKAVGLPKRFVASRLVEGDKEVLEALGLDDKEKQILEDLVCKMEEERGLDRYAAMADMRYSFIRRLCARSIAKPRMSKERLRSNKIDKILTGKYTALPAFILIMGLVFWLTFDVIGVPLQNLLADGIAALGERVDSLFLSWNVSDPVRSLVVDAIFGGVGTVLSFIPIVIVLFFFLSMLEDSGYMARIAFVCDAFLRKIGLSGRSIVPMLIGFGCSVPAVMSARTLPSARDRRATILLIPFMSCSAKVPVYAFFAAAFFPEHAALAMIAMYLLGIALGIVSAVGIKLVRRRSHAAPFVMEMPSYRLPQARNVGHLLWDKTKDFVQKAFTVIFLATIVIWFLQTFDFRLNLVSDYSDSILARVSGLISPLFEPLGLGDWRVLTSLVSGFMAKESVVSTMNLLGVGEILTTASAVAMMVFCLLYTPCVAAIAAIRRELGGKWAVFVVVFQCLTAWLVAWIAYLLFSL